MIYTLSKHIKWRKDNTEIFICNCKKLIDLKIAFKYESFMKKLTEGIEKEKLNEEEKLVFSDFEKMKLISELKIMPLKEKDFLKAMNILDNELGKKRVRNYAFLHKKFKLFPQFFIGIFLKEELVGVICGFPREDYLLISEIAIDLRFQRRGFGKKLVKEFEKVAKGEYSKINVGAQDNVINFYNPLGYKPFLLVQFEKGIYSLKDFNNYKVIDFSPNKIEIKIESYNFKNLEKLRKKYPKANFQYIFSKEI